MNARPRRGARADRQAELQADAAWLLPPATREVAEASCRVIATELPQRICFHKSACCPCFSFFLELGVHFFAICAVPCVFLSVLRFGLFFGKAALLFSP